MPAPPSLLLAPTPGYETQEQLAHLLLGLHSRLGAIERTLLLPGTSAQRPPAPELVEVALGLLAFRRTITFTIATVTRDAAAPAAAPAPAAVPAELMR